MERHCTLTSQLVIKFNDPKRVIQFSCCQCHDVQCTRHQYQMERNTFISFRRCRHWSARISIIYNPHFGFETLQDGKSDFSFARELARAHISSEHQPERTILFGILIKINKVGQTTLVRQPTADGPGCNLSFNMHHFILQEFYWA